MKSTKEHEKWPNWLYKDSEQITPQYSQNPKGQFTVSQLIAGKDKLFRHDLKKGTQRQKKILFLTDWSMKNWINRGDYYYYGQLKIFDELMKEGFTILGAVGNPLEVKTIQSITVPDCFTEKFQPISAKKAIQLACSTYNIAADDIEVLDYFGCNRLFSEHKLFENFERNRDGDILMAHLLLSGSDNEEIGNLENLLKENKAPQITLKIPEKIISKTSDAMDILQHAGIDKPIHIHLKIEDEFKLGNHLSNYVNLITSIECCKEHPRNFINFQKKPLYSEDLNNDLQKLLSISPNIETLTLKNHEDLSKIFTPNWLGEYGENLKHIKHLNLTGSGAFPPKLLSYMPSLEILTYPQNQHETLNLLPPQYSNIEKSDNTPIIIYEDKNRLTNSEKKQICISKIAFNKYVLFGVFNAIQDECRLQKEKIEPRYYYPNALAEKIRATYDSINENKTFGTALQFSGLAYISFNDKLSPDFQKTMKGIKDLSFYKTGLDFSTLQHFLILTGGSLETLQIQDYTSRIRKLNLSKTFSKDWLETNKDCLKNIKNLAFKNVEIDGESLSQLSSHIPGLKTLILKNSNNWPSLYFLKDKEPLNIQYLDFSNTNIERGFEEKACQELLMTLGDKIKTYLMLKLEAQLQQPIFRKSITKHIDDLARETLQKLLFNDHVPITKKIKEMSTDEILSNIGLSRNELLKKFDDIYESIYRSFKPKLLLPPCLKTLVLKNCKGLQYVLTEEWLHKNRDVLNQLTTLDLSGSDIRPEQLEWLLSHTPALELLNLDRCNHLSENGKYLGNLANLLSGLPCLSKFHCNFSSAPTYLNGDRSYFKIDLESINPDENLSHDIRSENSNTGEDQSFNSNPPTIKLNDISLSNTSPSIKPFGQYTKNAVQWIDANTGPTTQNQRSVERIFFNVNDQENPHPMNYRFQAFSSFGLSPNKVEKEWAFFLNNDEILDLRLVNRPYQSEDEDVLKYSATHAQEAIDQNQNIFYAKIEFSLSSEWKPLPSLSPNETLLHFHLDDKTLNYEIAYSERDSMYYIRSTSLQSERAVSLDYLLKAPKEERQPSSLPKEVQDLVDHYNNDFDSIGKELNLPEKEYTGKEYIEAIESQKTGSCRHRTIAMMNKMEILNRQLPKNEKIPCRGVLNDIHAFVEIFHEGTWVPCDLGGYLNNNIKIEDHQKPKSLPDPQNHIENEKLPEIKNEILLNHDNSLKGGDLPKHSNLEKANPLKIKIDKPLPPKPDFKEFFVTWETKSESPKSIKAFCRLLEQSESEKILVDFETKQAIQHFIPLILHHTKQPIYYIDSPDDLFCGDYLHLNDEDQLEIREGPGGSLFDFLTQESDTEKMLVVNFAKFTPEELVQFNSLIDTEQRTLNQIEIPENIKVVGLYSTHEPNSYKGSDFLGRFDEKKPCSIKTPDLISSVQELPDLITKNKFTEKDNALHIELYQSPDWESLLLGKIDLHGNTLSFKKGPLLEALEKGQNRIVIHNGPWGDPAFQRFWQKLQRDQSFVLYGKTYYLPKDFLLEKSQGYEWKKLVKPHTWVELREPPLSTDALTLNPDTLFNFLERYTCNNEGELYSQPGWLAEYANQSLTIQLTQDLSPDQWGRFLDSAKELNVTLTIMVPSNIKTNFSLPISEWHSEPIKKSNEKPKLESKEGSGEICLTSDRDETVNDLLNQHKDALVIDISECDSTHLLSLLKREKKDSKDTGKPSFKFEHTISSVWTALENGETVILTGQFSNELANHLASLCRSEGSYAVVNGERKTHKGRLFLVPEDPAPFKGLIKSEEISSKETTAPKYDFIHKQTKAKFSEIYSGIDNEQPWNGLYQCNEDSTDVKEYENLEDDEAFCQALDQERFKKVTDTWRYSPYVMLSGKTGAGKSTFIKEILEKTPGYSVFYEEDDLLNWVKSEKEGEKILFIDEANLTNTNWSRYEGLFNRPPGILIDGKYYKLTDQHRVIFAGNPLSYGGERGMPSLFERHGGSIIFNPLPPRYVAHRIIKPILTGLPEDRKAFALKIFMEIYEYIVQQSKSTILISPREMESMALKLMAYWKEDLSDQDFKSLVRYCAYHQGKAVLPEENQNSFDQWFNEKQCDLSTLQKPLSEEKKSEKFLITESRRVSYQYLQDLLQVRDYKINTPKTILGNGLGGMLFEGEPGAGKSEFVTAVLTAHGFHEAKKSDVLNQNSFCRIPANMSPLDKEKRLLEAFHAGAIVILDEANSCVTLEKLLNALLMGRDLQGNPPENSGFTLIGTQNPAYMAGRKATSIALQRRLMKICVPTYTREELVDIVCFKYPKLAERMDLTNQIIDDYQAMYALAQKEGKEPAPTTRNLFRVCKTVSKGISKPTLSKKQENLVNPPHPQKQENKNYKNVEEKHKKLLEKKQLRKIDKILKGLFLESLPPEKKARFETYLKDLIAEVALNGEETHQKNVSKSFETVIKQFIKTLNVQDIGFNAQSLLYLYQWKRYLGEVWLISREESFKLFSPSHQEQLFEKSNDEQALEEIYIKAIEKLNRYQARSFLPEDRKDLSECLLQALVQLKNEKIEDQDKLEKLLDILKRTHFKILKTDEKINSHRWFGSRETSLRGNENSLKDIIMSIRDDVCLALHPQNNRKQKQFLKLRHSEYIADLISGWKQSVSGFVKVSKLADLGKKNLINLNGQWLEVKDEAYLMAISKLNHYQHLHFLPKDRQEVVQQLLVELIQLNAEGGSKDRRTNLIALVAALNEANCKIVKTDMDINSNRWLLEQRNTHGSRLQKSLNEVLDYAQLALESTEGDLNEELSPDTIQRESLKETLSLVLKEEIPEILTDKYLIKVRKQLEQSLSALDFSPSESHHVNHVLDQINRILRTSKKCSMSDAFGSHSFFSNQKSKENFQVEIEPKIILN